MHDKKILASIGRIRNILEPGFSGKDFPEHHVRLSKFKIEYLESDFKELFLVLERLEKEDYKSREQYERFLIKIYYVLGEDILKNLSFDFLGQEDVNAEIISVFKGMHAVFRETNMKIDMALTQKLKSAGELIKTEFFIIQKEIELLHSEKSIIKKIRKKHSLKLEKIEEQTMLVLHNNMFSFFKALHRDMKKYYYNLMHGKTTSWHLKEHKKEFKALLEQLNEQLKNNKELKPVQKTMLELKENLFR